MIDGNIEPCMMCKRYIINAGISRVIVRKTKDEYKIIYVSSWIENEETIAEAGY